jgi:hypothetical protein
MIKTMKLATNIAAIFLFIVFIFYVRHDLKDRSNNIEFSRKLFETAYKAGQANEAYKVYMFQVNHVHFSADSMFKADSVKIDSMICNYY